MAGLQRQLTSHIRWLRTNRAHGGSLQRSLIHEFQVAMNGGAILQRTLGQAMLYARGLPPPNHPCLADPYPPLNPGKARRSSQKLLDEVTVHCDILGRLLQAYSGETMAHKDRVRSHLTRMEHSPFQTACSGETMAHEDRVRSYLARMEHSLFHETENR